MSSCDICGMDKKTMLTDIENAKIYVCNDCNPSGQGVVKRTFASINNNSNYSNNSRNSNIRAYNVKRKVPKNFSKFSNRMPMHLDSKDYNLFDNYGEIIRKAREQKGLTLNELSQNLKEQESYIHKIEQGKLKPNDAVIFKLYNFLGVNLIKSEDDDLIDNNVENVKEEIKHVEAFTQIISNKKRKLVY